MSKFIIPDSGAALQALVAFIITFAVFTTVMIRAWHMRREHSEHLANLPLEDDTKELTANSSSKQLPERNKL